MEIKNNKKSVKMQKLQGRYAVSRLDSKSDIPSWVEGEGFISITRTSDELSIVCLETRVPQMILSERDWVCLKFIGPFAFGEYGIVVSVVMPISAADMGVFVISTYDGDHLMVKSDDYHNVKRILTDCGHIILE